MINENKLSPKEAAKYIGVGMRTLMNMARTGSPKGGRLGSGKGKGAPWFFLKKDLDEYLSKAVDENYRHITGEQSAKKPRRRNSPPPALDGMR